MSFWSDAGNFFSDAGKVVENGAIGAGVGFVTGGPLGAVLGGTYGLAKGSYGVIEGAPMGRTIYQTVLPVAAAGLVIGATTLPAVQATNASGLLPGGGYGSLGAPTLSDTLSAQTSALGGAFGAAPSKLALGTNSILSSLSSGLSKFAASGALIGLGSSLLKGGGQAFQSAASHAPSLGLPSMPSLPSIPNVFAVPGAGGSGGAPVIVNAAQPGAAGAAGISPLWLVAAAAVAAWYLFEHKPHHSAAHA